MKLDNIFPRKTEIPQKYLLPEPIHQKRYLIDGNLIEWEGERQNVDSPVYCRVNNEFENQIGSYPLLGEKESHQALEAAEKAWDSGKGKWPAMTVNERIAHVQKFVILMKAKRAEVVNLLMWEIGKSYKSACSEFDRTVEYINDTIDELKIMDRDSSSFTVTKGIIAQIKRAPLGIVLCMGPFNYPLNETFTTLIPALLMGNVVIFKPPKLGVLLHYPLLQAFQKAFPAGVVNTVYGDGKKVISPLMQSGKIDVLAFIGSCKVADILKKQHPQPHRLKSILGLEAKNPAIILPDADLDLAVEESVIGALSYNGQRCTALKILFVHEELIATFQEKFCRRIEELKMGMPWDKDVDITPLPEPGKSKILQELLDDATSKGAEIINQNGGKSNRSFFYPAVVSGITSEMRLYHEEQFGPIVPLVSYSDLEEPLNYVINSNYGQQASIFGQDSEAVSRLLDTLVNQVCRVNINSQCQRGPDTFPFTGRKDSAENTLSVSDALKVFSIRTLAAAKGTSVNKKIIAEIVENNKSKFLTSSH